MWSFGADFSWRCLRAKEKMHAGSQCPGDQLVPKETPALTTMETKKKKIRRLPAPIIGSA